ncbi:NusG domain II-containing protein [Pseudolactococcus yaeyamensis]
MGKLQHFLTAFKALQMKPLDFIIIICLMMASFTPFLLLGNKSTPNRQAQLRVDAQIIKSFDLTKNQTYTYQDDDGDSNKIEVRDGRIAIVYANCGDQICVRKGFINQTGQTIVCLPHKLVIEVMPSGDDDGNRIIDY